PVIGSEALVARGRVHRPLGRGRLLMRKTMTAGLAAAMLSATLGASDLPLALRDFVAGPNAHVRIVNTAGQAITAWSLAITTHLESGRTHREVVTADGYLSEVT